MHRILFVVASKKESSINSLISSITARLSDEYQFLVVQVKNDISNMISLQDIRNNVEFIKKCNIVHFHASIAISLAPLFKLINHRAKFISTEHDYGWTYFKNTLPFSKSLLLRFTLNIGRRFCQVHIYPSKSLMLAATRNYFPIRDPILVYNGLDDIKVDSKTQKQEGTFPKRATKSVIVVGNYFYSKGFDLIYKISQDMPDYDFHLYGNIYNGLSEDEIKEIKRTNNMNNIKLHGLVPRKDFLQVLNDYRSIICLPSRSEVCPLLLIEALATEHPIVVSDIDVFKELSDASYGITFKLSDTNSLISAIVYAARHYQELGHRGRQKYLSTFTARIMVDKYNKIYQRAMRN
jgi:glycosyltransferase involved in cell wall biosynthesis